MTIEELVATAKDQGFLTKSQFQSAMPSEITDQEQLSDIENMIISMGIKIVESHPKSKGK